MRKVTTYYQPWRWQLLWLLKPFRKRNGNTFPVTDVMIW